MAIKYFDLNGATAGFGTLTGAWNTTGAAFWSDSSAGTATPTNYTFTSADTAAFGFAGTTATAGIATIATGVNVELNKITTANLATMQTIAATGTGKLTLAADGATVPAIGVASGGGLTISARVDGTSGFTKTGLLYFVKATGSTLSGTLTHSSGYTQFGSATTDGNVFPNVTSIVISTTGQGDPFTLATNTTIDPFPSSFSGTGGLQVQTYGSTYVQFGAGALANLNSNPSSWGLATQAGAGGTALNGFIKVKDFPSGRISYLLQANTATGVIEFNGASSGAYSPSIYISRIGAITSTASALVANGSVGAALTLSGPLTCDQSDTTSAFTHTFRGTNVSDNTYSGAITNGTSTALSIAKAEAGRWILSGANTYTGTTATQASGGTLVAKSSTALGATTGAVTIVSGTTLEIDGSAGDIALNKSSAQLTIGGTGDGGNGAIYSSAGLNNSYTSSSTVLTAESRIRVAAGSKLTMTGVISDGVGPYGVVKTVTGELVLPSANTYKGPTLISAGTLSVTTLANGGAASGIGQSSNAAANLVIGAAGASGTLKHTGAAASTDRNWTGGTGVGVGPTIDASGSGVLTMTSTTAPSFSSSNTASTITVRGSAGNGTSTFNTYSQPVSDNGTGAVSFVKADAGAWKITNATLNFTGGLSLSGGFLDLNNTARTLSSNITVSGGTLQNGSATVAPATSVTMTGGKITANLTGAGKTFVANAGSSELAPQATNNDGLTGGTATVNNGAEVRLTSESATISTTGGKVLGSMAVSVENGGAIRTTVGTLQRGQARYGGNVTFKSGSTLYIG